MKRFNIFLTTTTNEKKEQTINENFHTQTI